MEKRPLIVKSNPYAQYLAGILPGNEHLFKQNLSFSFIVSKLFFFFNIVPAKVKVPFSTVRVLKGYKISCSATGTPPIQTKAMWNSSVMASASDVLTIRLNKEGKYVCEAKNQFGKDKKEFSVKFAGKNGYLNIVNRVE